MFAMRYCWLLIFSLVALSVALECFKSLDATYGLTLHPIPSGNDYQRSDVYLNYYKKAQKAQALRLETAKKVLAEGAGVYRDKRKGEELKLEKTVLTTVISHPKASHWYRIYFRNFLCFAEHYGYDLVVYVMRNQEQSDNEFAEHVAEIGRLGIKVLPFPEELFWRFVYGRVNPLREGKRRVPYKGDRPDFKEFGSLPMLIPMYEIIALGYNMIYYDVDLGLVLDPIPHMLYGDSDFVSSVETRECVDHPHVATVRTTNWEVVEFNTGVTLIRSTNQSRALMVKWIEAMVNENYVNDQRVIDKWFRRFNDMTYTSNCLPPSTKGAIEGDKISQRKTPGSATYCLLSDVVFQNGLMSLTCCRQRMDSYIINMAKYGIKIGNSYYPALIHVNFSGGKTQELTERGLWLFQQTNGSSDGTRGTCLPYSHESSHYSHNYNYSSELKRIYAGSEEMYKGLNRPGTTMRLKNAQEVFVIGNDSKLHGFPDGDTFVAMGYDFGDVALVDSIVQEKWDIGEPLVSLAAEDSQTARKRRKHDAIMEIRNKDGTNAPFESPNIS